MPTKPVTARERLELSRLDPQNQIQDVDIQILRLFIKGKIRANIAAQIVSADVERTIEGASTVTVKILDPDREVLKSGLLGREVDIQVDGLYFRLAKVGKQGDELTLTFEDREIAVLRTYNKPKKASRDTTTRAQFVKSLIKEVKEFNIPTVIPELNVKQPVEKAPADDSIDFNRSQGMGAGADLRVKGLPASREQIKNSQTILHVGINMGAPRVLLLASMMAAIVESTIHNYPGGDLDSVGVFQQRASWGPYEDRHNVAKAAKKFFNAGLAQLRGAGGVARGISAGNLAQLIQRSAFPDRYQAVQKEANAFVTEFAPGADDTGMGTLDWQSGGAAEYEFMRGEQDSNGHWTKEDSWTCIQRLANEVQWRAFFVSGTFYYISEPRIFEARARIAIEEFSEGVDFIDGDYDVGKKNAVLTVSARIDRWNAPPGSIIRLKNMGPMNGRWLVTQVRRSMFSFDAEIILKKPLPKLPEPAPTQSQMEPFGGALGGFDTRARIVAAAERAYKNRSKYVYRQYRPMPDSLFISDAYHKLDCSAFATLCYKAGGAPDPNGFNYNGSGYTGTLVRHGKHVSSANAQPGDLVFYGSLSGENQMSPSHVAVYIGDGQVISFGSTPIHKLDVHYRTDFLGFRTYSMGRRPAGVGKISPQLPEYA